MSDPTIHPTSPTASVISRASSSEQTLAAAPKQPRDHHTNAKQGTAQSPENKDSRSSADEKGKQGKNNLLVEFTEDDARNPHNWSLSRKIVQTVLLTLATFYSGLASAVLSPADDQLVERFGVSSVAAELCNSMFILGFIAGPQVFGPLSELYGRKLPIALGIFISGLFALQTAVADNYTTILIGRLISGTFASAPYAVGGGCFHDMLDEVHVQAGIAFFAVATAGGPAWGPIVGSAIITTGPGGWRWIGWFTCFFAFFVTALFVLFFRESYEGVILQREASSRRIETGEMGWHAEMDKTSVGPKDILTTYLFRPLYMLFTEPILFFVNLYLMFMYGLLYMLLAAIPVIYGELRGMKPFVASLTFISFFVGMFGASLALILDMVRYKKLLKKRGVAKAPEERFVPMGIAAIMLPIGLFWFAFTGPAQTSSPWPSIIAFGSLGCSTVVIFEMGITYMIDTYPKVANSAISANILMRSPAGGAYPLFVPGMIHNLGYQSTWAMALLGFLSVSFIPLPILFYFYGAKLRRASPYADHT